MWRWIFFLQSLPIPQKTNMRHNHIENVKVTAHFSKDKRYRYRLEITHDHIPSGKTVCVIMQNPSYACVEFADKSVQFMQKVIFLKGLPEFKNVRRLIVVNQFAFIQTNLFKGLPHEVGVKNNAAIQTAFEEADMIVMAWGCGNPFKERQKFALELLKKMKRKKLFITRSHPSRARYAGFIRPFSLENTSLTSD